MCEANQEKFDRECPADFQSADYVLQHGQLDMVLEASESATAVEQAQIEAAAGRVFALLAGGAAAGAAGRCGTVISGLATLQSQLPKELVEPSAADMAAPFNYTNSRAITRPQAQDLVAQLFEHYVQLVGDGRVGKDSCILGGIAAFGPVGAQGEYHRKTIS